MTSISESSERNKKSFTTRWVLLLGGLGLFSYLYMEYVGGSMGNESEKGVVEKSYEDKKAHHSSSFGGENNLAQPAGMKKNGALTHVPIFIPTSNVGHSVPSLSEENILNLYGHYVHDEHRSPYASPLYDREKIELESEQTKYEKKMDEIRKTWGAWDLHDSKERPKMSFDKFPYRDADLTDFPNDSWQTDEDYVNAFILEAKGLVQRVLDGIYAEYGMPTNKTDGTQLTNDEITERDEFFSVHHDGKRKFDKGIGWLTPLAWDALIRKLLHAIITNDEFYVVLGGHSAAAGHGNDFQQTFMMAFHYIMEPVFDKLGMRLITRNMAQGGVGTTMSAFGGADIYGEVDIMLWDSYMTERQPGAHDLFNKQAILSGERVPVLLTMTPHKIEEDSDNTAWIGDWSRPLNDPQLTPLTKDEKQVETLPFATQYMNCETDRDDLCKAHKFNAICWEQRRDVTPTTKQGDQPGSQVGWHPGNRAHQFIGRKISLIVLHALNAALDKWLEGIKEDNFPLSGKYWHVGDTYKHVQESLRTHINIQEDTKEKSPNQVPPVAPSECETLFKNFPRVCRVAMHAYTEWTPRVNPDSSSLRSIVVPAPNGYKPHKTLEEEYTGSDVMPLIQRIPNGEVDVHAIAIVSTAKAPDLDHSWVEDGHGEKKDDDDDNSRGPRRELWTRSELIAQSNNALMEEQRRRRRTENVVEHEAEATSNIRGTSHELDPSKSITHRSVQDEANDDKNDEEIVPGRGWYWNQEYTGFCDGSSMSECKRHKENPCLMYGHNDGRAGLYGDGLSGWLIFKVEGVKEGIILLRMEWWVPKGQNPITEEWKEVNNGKTKDETPPSTTAPTSAPTVVKEVGKEKKDAEGNTSDEEADDQRRLGTPDPLPDDTFVDFSINGKIVRTMDKTEFMAYSGEIVKNFAIWPVMDDAEMAKKIRGDDDKGETFFVGIRIRSESESRKASIKISHVYYA